jgi:hypothetical protein
MHRSFIIPQASQPTPATPLISTHTPKPSFPCSCGCSEVLLKLSENSTHYAAWHCTECNRFRGWVPKPSNLTAQHAENELISRLLASGSLNDWELGFCESLKNQKNRSLKQKQKLREIAKRLGLTGQEQIAGSSSQLFCAEGGEG